MLDSEFAFFIDRALEMWDATDDDDMECHELC